MELLLLLFIGGIFFLLTGLTIYSNYRSLTNITFSLFLVLLFSWILTNYLSNTVKEYQYVLGLNKLIFPVTLSMLLALHIFTEVYPNKSISRFSLFNKLLFVFTILVTLISFTNQVVRDVEILETRSDIIFGDLVYLYFVNVVMLVVTPFVNLYKKYKNLRGLNKVRLQYLLIGIALSAAGAITTNFVLPIIFSNFEFTNVGPLFFLIFAFFTTYSIVRFRFLGVRVIIGNLMTIMIIAALNLGLFYLTIAIDQSIFNNYIGLSVLFLNLFLSVIVTTLTIASYNFVKEIISNAFIYVSYSPSKEIEKLNSSISTVLNVKEVVREVIQVLTNTLKAENINVHLYESGKKFFIKKTELNAILEISIKLKSRIVILEELKEIDLNSYRNLSIKFKELTAILLLIDDKDVLGLISIGKRNSPYDLIDLQFLQNIAISSTVSLGRARYLGKYEALIENLEVKINDATEELRIKNTQLAEALRKEQDMMDIIGHELRTPVGTARNALMFLDQLVQKNNLTKDKYEKYMGIAIENIKREKDLLQTILQSARMENDRLQTKKELIFIKDVIDDSLTAFKEDGESKGLKIIVDSKIDKKELIVGDRNALQQIVDNLLSNAIKYTYKGSVTISLTETAKKIKLAIVDTGEGISKNDLQNIGKKFFRANPYLNSKGLIDGKNIVRPGGTGIGIYVVKGLLKSMKSTLHIKSKVGEGSTFSFSLNKATDKDKETLPMAERNSGERMRVI